MQQSRGDAGFIVVQSGEGREIPDRGCRGAPTPKEQRTDTYFTLRLPTWWKLFCSSPSAPGTPSPDDTSKSVRLPLRAI